MSVSAVPSRLARFAALLAIVVAGFCGGLIGYALTQELCVDECNTTAGFVGLGGAIATATGVAIVVALALKASTEWHDKQTRRRAQQVGGFD